MTKKDYEILASILGAVITTLQEYTEQIVIDCFSNELQKENIEFSEKKFRSKVDDIITSTRETFGRSTK